MLDLQELPYIVQPLAGTLQSSVLNWCFEEMSNRIIIKFSAFLLALVTSLFCYK